MNNLNTLKGMILGMEQMGAKYIKTDGVHLYFELQKENKFDDEKLKRAKDAFLSAFRLGLKVRRL